MMITAVAIDECVICLDAMHLSFRTLECGHTFHEECIGKWARTKGEDWECPLCRHNVGESDDNEALQSMALVRFANDRVFVQTITLANAALSLAIFLLSYTPALHVLINLTVNMFVALYGYCGASLLSAKMLCMYILLCSLSMCKQLAWVWCRHSELDGSLIVLNSVAIGFQVYISTTVFRMVKTIRKHKSRLLQYIHLHSTARIA